MISKLSIEKETFKKELSQKWFSGKKKKNSSLNEVSDLEHVNQSYNAILEFLL